MSGRVFEQLDLIVCARDNFAFPNNHRADWNFVDRARFHCQAQRLLHKRLVQFHSQRPSPNDLERSTSSSKRYVHAASSWRSTCTTMKKLFFILTISSLSLIAAN